MKTKPVAWMDENENVIFEKNWAYPIPLYTQDQLEEARKLGMQQEGALWNLSESTQEFESFDRTASHMAGEYVAHPVKELTDRIAELENQLGFIVSINRAGLGVVTATPMPSEKIEKIWNAIEEQRDDNFHYGWKKCEQYYGFAHPVKELTDEEIIDIWYEEQRQIVDFARAILRKAQE